MDTTNNGIICVIKLTQQINDDLKRATQIILKLDIFHICGQKLAKVLKKQTFVQKVLQTGYFCCILGAY